MGHSITIGGIEISHPDKELFPSRKIDKEAVADYYADMSEQMLPFLKNRPVSLRRFPDGVNQDGFFQKKAADYFPGFVERVEVETNDGVQQQIMVNNRETLIYLANQGTISFHPWLSKEQALKCPDRFLIDLDPDEENFNRLKKAARLIRKFFQKKERSLKIMTTGSRGLHLWSPLKKSWNFDELRKAVKQWCQEIQAQYPERFTVALPRKERRGRIFLDYLRNSYAQTSICPFSLRANEDAGVATPIAWSELNKISSARHYHFKNIRRRLAQLP